jgi:hypothetical protein
MPLSWLFYCLPWWLPLSNGVFCLLMWLTLSSDVYCGGSTISPNDNEGIQKSYDEVCLFVTLTITETHNETHKHTTRALSPSRSVLLSRTPTLLLSG